MGDPKNIRGLKGDANIFDFIFISSTPGVNNDPFLTRLFHGGRGARI